MTHKTLPGHVELDAIAWKILENLQGHARMSFAELGRKVGLSTPAVAERVRRLEEAGVIFINENGEGRGVRLRKKPE